MTHPARLPSIRQALTSRSPGIRPPWSNEHSVRNACTSCGDCIAACPEGILVAGPANTPVVDFSQNACTFCGECASACSEPVFSDRDAPPWNLVAEIGGGCMLSLGISCQICTDICDRAALRMDLSVRPAGRIIADAQACTGCGACLSVCPADAIELQDRVPADA